MLGLLSDKIREHIIKNPVSYILLTLFFSIGVIGGAYVYNMYSKEEVALLYDFFEKARELYINEDVNSTLLFKNAFISSLNSLLLVWFFGFTVIGIPVIFFVIIKKGFVFGLVANFLMTNFKYGILLTITVMFLETVILTPLLVVASTYGISLSRTLFNVISGRIKYRIDIKSYLFFYTLVFIIALIVIVIYGLLEGYLMGNLLKWLLVKLT